MSDKREQIIESATRMIRTGGYNTFSFREIATEVGVKSSSVHYYFARKEDLAAVVAERYSDAFFEALGPADVAIRSTSAVIEHYGTVFVDAFNASGKACLCGILSHESPSIPKPVLTEVSSFIDKNIEWLSAAFAASDLYSEAEDLLALARTTYTALNGAMAVATLKHDVSWIETVRAQLIGLTPD